MTQPAEIVKLQHRVNRLSRHIMRLTNAREEGEEALGLAMRQAADYLRSIEPFDERSAEFSDILPAWFVERMSIDVWDFGLLLTTGQVLHVQELCDIHQGADGSLWADFRMSTENHRVEEMAARGWPPLLVSPSDREVCSVNLAHVVCAIELADT